MSNLKVGTLGYAINRGLGHLVRDFYKNGIVTDVIQILHNKIPNEYNWYSAPKIPINELYSKPYQDLLTKFITDMDIMLFFETPFDWRLFDLCRKLGKKSILMTMYECTPKRITQCLPDVFWCPSKLDFDVFTVLDHNTPSYLVTVPTNPIEDVKPKGNKVRKFAHNGGYLGLRGREGTRELIKSLEYIQSDIELEIRTQENVEPEYINACYKDKRVKYINGTMQHSKLFEDIDCYIAPQKFNGLSYPLQEACTNGVSIITTKRYPMTTWLPNELMIEPKRKYITSVGGAYLDIEECELDPRDIAKKIDSVYNTDCSIFGQAGIDWSNANSWEKHKTNYINLLKQAMEF